MKLTFVTPGYSLDGIPFGAASLGMVGCEDAEIPALRQFACDLEGTVIAGSYEECLASLPATVPRAAVVLFGNAGGENGFLAELSRRMPCPMTGGGAAFADSARKGLISGGGEVAVFLIDDSRYDVEVVSHNIHERILETCRLELENPRQILSVNGEDPVTWYNRKRVALGVPETDFEHLTLSDEMGVNAHLSVSGGKLVSGRDLRSSMILRYAEPDKVWERMRRFYDDKNSVVFGCAGLKGLLSEPLGTAGLGLFLFGEVCTVGGRPEFGNLMLSKLVVRPKRAV